MSERSDEPRFKFCVICGGRYERRGKASNKAWNGRITCSKACGAKHRQQKNLGRINRFCQQCRVTQLLWFQDVFCSSSCMEIWNDENEYNAPPEILQEWPEWMAIKKPFVAHDRDPGDGNAVRLRGPDPHRLGNSLYGSSADWAMSHGGKAGRWERKR